MPPPGLMRQQPGLAPAAAGGYLNAVAVMTGRANNLILFLFSTGVLLPFPCILHALPRRA